MLAFVSHFSLSFFFLLSDHRYLGPIKNPQEIWIALERPLDHLDGARDIGFR